MKTAKVTGLGWIRIDGKLVRLDLRLITGYEPLSPEHKVGRSNRPGRAIF